jgi:hypothetical protein
MLSFTQGDNVILNLSATDGNGNAINLTGASFSTQILGANGAGPITFSNSQHAITSAATGQFQLTLSQTDSANCGIGQNKDILTAITLSGNVTYFRGIGILNVYPPVPLQ